MKSLQSCAGQRSDLAVALRLSCLAGVLLAAAGCDRPLKPTGAAGPAVLVASGLEGTWALDCGSDPRRENPHIVYTVPASGDPAEQFIARDPRLDRTTPMRDIKALEGQHVAWTQKVAGKSVDVIVRVEGARHRVWQSILSDGTVLVSGGKLDGGVDTPWFNKCTGGSDR